MEVIVQPRSYPPEFTQFFPPHKRALGHEPEMLSAADDEWYSILVGDGQRALAHTIAPKSIGPTGLCDVEPFLGYGGLLTNCDDPSFLGEALAYYSAACRGLKVVAELIRFDPVLRNHEPFADRAELGVVPTKQIVVVSCEQDAEKQMARFSSPCRRRLRRGLNELSARTLDKAKEVDRFRSLQEASLRRVAADGRWFLPDRFYSQIVASPTFEIQTVWSGDHLAAAAVVGHHATASHYVLAANSEDYLPGAGERLIYEIARSAAARGQRNLLLGGGNTTAPDDPLLRYKSRFAAATIPFFIGMMVHDRQNFDALEREAVALHPEIAERNYFLKYRLAEQAIQEGAP